MRRMSSAASSLSNHLLIALPQLDDPNFARTVTLICRHDEEGAMGLTLNRASEYHMSEILSQLGLEDRSGDLGLREVLFGGPVHPERGFVLHSDDGRDFDSTYRVSGTLKLTTSRDILASMAAGEGPQRALLALGCAGWGPGQLEEELAENAWLAVPAEDSILFELPLEQRWTRAAALIGVDLSLLTDYSGRA
jgi:putative transcriptional regulator